MVQKSFVLTALVALSGVAMVHADTTTPTPLQASIDMSGIKATLLFTPVGDSDTGANVTVNVLSGLTKKFAILPAVGFEYHVHVQPVGPNNDCMATGGHLDPDNIGTAVKCNPSTPEKCQEGDLSGKHGYLMPTDSGALPPITYVDDQLQFTGVNTTIVGRSIVIHNNGTRVACGNILPVGGGSQTASPPVAANSDGQKNGAASENRISREVLWMVLGTVGSGVMAALMAL
ncbi:hypothetical protein BGX28_004343 [Mortierella sp. GBA30]|nr:hypothetical protein BGX28_004343 [Mortierella sp. GBA30]